MVVLSVTTPRLPHLMHLASVEQDYENRLKTNLFFGRCITEEVISSCQNSGARLTKSRKAWMRQHLNFKNVNWLDQTEHIRRRFARPEEIIRIYVLHQNSRNGCRTDEFDFLLSTWFCLLERLRPPWNIVFITFGPFVHFHPSSESLRWSIALVYWFIILFTTGEFTG